MEYTFDASQKIVSFTLSFTASGNATAYLYYATITTESSAIVLPALSAPANLALSGDAGTSSFTVTWDEVSDATGYAVTLLDDSDNEIDSLSLYAGDTTATFTGLSASTTYTVSVVANGDGSTFADSPATTRSVTTAPPSVTLSTPDSLSASSITPVSFTASWTGDENADEYEVEAFEQTSVSLDFNNFTTSGATRFDLRTGEIDVGTGRIAWETDKGRFYSNDCIHTNSATETANAALTIQEGHTLSIGPIAGVQGMRFTSKQSGSGTAESVIVTIINADTGSEETTLDDGALTTGSKNSITNVVLTTASPYTQWCRIVISVGSDKGDTANLVIDDIEIDTFAPISETPQTTSSASCTVSGLSANTDYYWRVRATGDGTATDWATSDSLVHTRANAAPTLSLIANGTSGATSITIATNTTLTVVLSATDPDGDAIADYFMGASNFGSLSGNTFTWTPMEAQVQPVQFGFYAIDEYNGWSEEATLDVTVIAPGAKPVVTITPVGETTIAAGETVSATVATDKGSLNAPTAPQGVAASDYTFNAATGAFTFTPPALGSYTFTFTATDPSDGTSDPVSFTVTANALQATTNIAASNVGETSFTATWNTVPGANSYEVSLYRIVPHTLDFTGSGASGTGASFYATNGIVDGIVWNATNGRINQYNETHNVNIDGETLAMKADSTLTFGPFPNGVKEVSLAYRAATGALGKLSVQLLDGETNIVETLATTLDAKNTDAVRTNFPAATPCVPESRLLRLVATTNPVAVDDIVVTAFEQQGNAQTVSGGTSLAFSGLSSATDYLVAVSAASGGTVSSAGTAVLSTIGNHAPTLTLSADSTNTVVGAEVSVTLTGSDADGDELTYSVSPAAYAANLVGNVFTWTPNAVGTTVFSFTASDDQATSEASTFTVAATLATPMITSAVATECNAASIAWTAVPGADHYLVGAVGTIVRGTAVCTSTNGWACSSVHPGNADGGDEDASVAKFGTGSAAGSLTSPALDLSGNSGTFVVVFDARQWKGDDTTLDVTHITQSGPSVKTVDLTDEMATYAVPFTGGTSASTVMIASHSTSKNRFYLKALRVVSGTATQQTVADVSVAAGTTSYSATGLTPDTAYTFTVTAVAEVDGAEMTTSASAFVMTPEPPSRTVVIFR